MDGNGFSARFPARSFVLLLLVVLMMAALLGTQPVQAQSTPTQKGDQGLRQALESLNDRARAYGLANQAPPSSPSLEASLEAPVTDSFEVLGHNDLGARDTNGDVWVHGDFAYVGTWAVPCTGRGVKIIDVSDLTAPRVIGALAARRGTSAEDMVVRSVTTDSFTGDLLGVGIQRCGSQPALDRMQFGVEFWDVSNPRQPRRLSELGLTNGGGGVHELDLFQRDGNVYALVATPFSEWFDPVPAGDFRIIDVTDPRRPVQVAEWGAGENSFSPGPFFGQGSFGAAFGHSARASVDGNQALVSYWDLGVLTFDLTDIADPKFIGQTKYAPDDDGEAHSVAQYNRFLLQNDEDFDPRSPAHINYGRKTGIGNESPGGPPLWLENRAHQVRARVVRADNQGCSVEDYPEGTAGKIAVVKTPFPFFDEITEDTEFPECLQQEQEAAAEAAGAVAVVHDFIADNTSPQWFDFDSVGIPVLFTDHDTARGMVQAGSATLEAQEPSWGFLRVFDAATGRQVAKFDDLPHVHELPVQLGDWSIHNNEVTGDRAYASWYSHGIVALDLTPLNRARPADPRKVGQFVPPAAPSTVPFLSDKPVVWGVAIGADDQGETVIFASDMNSGLWIVKPTGAAAP
jgi:hypothetical protein